MPSKSKSQQRLMGWVHACQTGRGSNCDRVSKIAGSIKPEDAKDFAKTSHEGLPNRVKKKPKSFKEFVTQKDITMRDFNQWKEDIAAVPGTEVPEYNPYANAKIGPQNRLSAPVNAASKRFDKQAGDSINNMSVNQKLHFITDTIMGMTGQDAESITADHNLLRKIRGVLVKIDNALKQQQ
jgi:hypothetical protein